MYFISVTRVLFIPLMISSMVQFSSTRNGKYRLKFCKLDYLMECFSEPNLYFTAQTNGTGIPHHQEDFEQFCFNQHDYGPYCARQWLNRCTNQVYFALVDRLYLNPLQTSIRTFCQPKGDFRSRFLKMAPCLINKVKLSSDYRKKCIRDLQASNEWIHQNALKDKDLIKFFRNTCCSYNKWEKCIIDQLNNKCGSDSSLVFPYLIHFNSIDLLKMLCPIEAFNPNDSGQCNPKDFQAPIGYIPRGWLSTSIISHLFSYYCPNVGYGIDINRDL